MRKWTVVVLIAIALLFGCLIYQHWRITSTIGKLMDKDVPIEDRKRAVARLGAIGPVTKDVIPALIWALQQSGLQNQAGLELAEIGPPAIPVLIELLEDEDARRRHWGAWVWGEMWETPGLFVALSELRSDPDVNAKLNLALNDEDYHVRYWAAQALGRITGDGEVNVGVNSGVNRVIVPPAPEGSGERQLTTWIENLAHEDALVRAWAADHLGRMGREAERAVPLLTDALHDENEMVRATATWALRMINLEAARHQPYLIEQPQQPDPPER